MNKQRLAFLLLLVIAALVFILAATVNQIQLKPGQPLSLALQPALHQNSSLIVSGGRLSVQFLKLLLGIFIILVPVSLVLMFFNKEWRRRLAVMMVCNVLMVIACIVWSRFVPQYGTPHTKVETTVERSTAVHPIQFAEPSKQRIFMVSLVIAVILSGIVLVAIWRFRKQHQVSRPGCEMLAEEAWNALQRLETGEEFRKTIIRCYREMMQIVRNTHGIIREQHMTPREFEIILKSYGIPDLPVVQLTRLFEKARYGADLSGYNHEQLAVQCLQKISEICSVRKTHET